MPENPRIRTDDVGEELQMLAHTEAGYRQTLEALRSDAEGDVPPEVVALIRTPILEALQDIDRTRAKLRKKLN